MPLIVEAANLGVIPISSGALNAINAWKALLDSNPSATLADVPGGLEALQEMRDYFANTFNCKQFRDFLDFMGVFGCAKSKRVSALAAALGISPETIHDCLAKDRSELESEIDPCLQLGNPFQPVEPFPTPEACGTALAHLLCPEEAPAPGPENVCALPSSNPFTPGPPDDALPERPDCDQAIDFALTITAELTAAMAANIEFSTGQLQNIARKIAALNCMPYRARCLGFAEAVDAAVQKFADYLARFGFTPPGPTPETGVEIPVIKPPLPPIIANPAETIDDWLRPPEFSPVVPPGIPGGWNPTVQKKIRRRYKSNRRKRRLIQIEPAPTPISPGFENR